MEFQETSIKQALPQESPSLQEGPIEYSIAKNSALHKIINTGGIEEILTFSTYSTLNFVSATSDRRRERCVDEGAVASSLLKSRTMRICN